MNYVLTNYKRHIKHKKLFMAILSATTLLLALSCACIGTSGMSLSESIKAFFRLGSDKNIMIMWNIRIPRVVAAICAGTGLSLSGCIMQNVLCNPLASPSTLGVSNAAVFGANYAISILGAGAIHSTHGETLTVNNPYIVTLCAFICAFGSIMFALVLTGRRGFGNDAIVLAGVALGALFTAGTTVIQYFSPDVQVAAAVYWSFGDLGRASYTENAIIFAVTLVCAIFFYIKRWDYNALSNGEETALSLGVKTSQLRVISLFLSSIICAVCVSFLGIIGFVGLIAPQAVKRFIGSDYRFLIPSSALLGASLILFSDTISRIVMRGTALPVGAVTSLLGAPVFLMLLIRKRGRRI